MNLVEVRKYKKESELKNAVTKIKNTLEGINSRLDDREEWISDMEGRIVEITQSEKQKEELKKKKNKDTLRDLWGIIKYASICIIGVLEGKKKEGVENLFEEIMTKNLPNLEKETVFRSKKHRAFPTK